MRVWQDKNGAVYAIDSGKRTRPVVLTDDDESEVFVYPSATAASIDVGAHTSAAGKAIAEGCRLASWIVRWATVQEALTLDGATLDRERHAEEGTRESMQYAKDGSRVRIVLSGRNGPSTTPVVVGGRLYLSNSEAAQVLKTCTSRISRAADAKGTIRGQGIRYATVADLLAVYPDAVHREELDRARRRRRKRKRSKALSPAVTPPETQAVHAPRAQPKAPEAPDLALLVAIKSVLEDEKISDARARRAALALVDVMD